MVTLLITLMNDADWHEREIFVIADQMCKFFAVLGYVKSHVLCTCW